MKIENAAVAADQPMVVAWHLTRAALPANLHHGLGQRCEGPNIHATPKWLHRFPRVSGLRAARGFLDAGLSSRSDDDRSGKLACRRVEQLRADMASGEAERVARAACQWLAVPPQHAAILPAMAVADSLESVLALLHAGPAKTLREATDVIGRTAAIQSVAIVAETPSAPLETLTAGWCGVRLVRQVPALHGMRPGIFGTLALLQKTAMAAATVAATEMAVNVATHSIIAHPLLRRVAGDVAGAGVAARRIIVLARAAGAACSPLSRG